MPKISSLTSLASPDSADEMAIVDTSATTTKKITLTGIKSWLATASSWVVATNVDMSTWTHTRAYLASTYVAPANNSVITIDTKDYDTLNEFNTSTYTFTAISAGKYQIIAQYFFGSSGLGTTESALLALEKNSTTIVLTSGKYNGSGDANRLTMPQIIGTLSLSASDTLRLKHQGSGGVRDVVGGSPYTYFEIHRVG